MNHDYHGIPNNKVELKALKEDLKFGRSASLGIK